MNRYVRYMLITGMAIIVTTAEAQQVKRTELPNGLVIVTKKVITNNIVSVVVALKMGSLYETDNVAGLCSLMQDTIIKGTKNRASEQIALELESMGTRLGSSSEREYGNLTLQSTAESFGKSLDILYDIIINPTFPDDAVNLQKNLQIRSILMRQDQPLYQAVDLLVESHFGSHPFHKPRIGYTETVKNMTRDDLVRKYREIYVPNNMVISVVGNFDEKGFMDSISQNLGSLRRGDEPKKVPGAVEKRTQPVEKTVTRDTAADWFALGWTSPELNNPDFYAMEVLDAITGGSMNSRLFVAIREKRGLAYQVSSFVNARMAAGIFVAYIGTKHSTYDEAKQLLIEEILRMGSENAAPDELKSAKSYLKGMNIMSMESNSGQASQYAHYEVIGAGYNFVERYDKKIDAVTADNVLRVGKKYLDRNYALGGVIAK